MGLKFQTIPGLPSTSQLVFYLGLLFQGLSCISCIVVARLWSTWHLHPSSCQAVPLRQCRACPTLQSHWQLHL